MNPTNVYVWTMTMYIVVACTTYFLAMMLSLSSSTRTIGKRLAFAMTGTFPGVLLAQVVSVPFIVVLIMILECIAVAIQPSRSFFIYVGILLICLPLIVSGVGFYAGWRIAWEWAAGRPAKDMMVTDRLLGPLFRCVQRALRHRRILASCTSVVIGLLLACAGYTVIKPISTVELSRTKELEITNSFHESDTVHATIFTKWVCLTDSFLTSDLGRYSPVLLVKVYRDTKSNTIYYILGSSHVSDLYVVYQVEAGRAFPQLKFYYGCEGTP